LQVSFDCIKRINLYVEIIEGGWFRWLESIIILRTPSASLLDSMKIYLSVKKYGLYQSG